MSILRAKVMHSQWLSDTPLRPWVAVTFDGTKSRRDIYCTSSVGQKEDTSMAFEEHITEADIKIH